MKPGKEILTRLVSRAPLADPVSPGYSGAFLEHGCLDDGTQIVIKHISRSTDLSFTLTKDRGRGVLLWQTGFLDALPASVDHAILAGWQENGEWCLVMRDVSDVLLGEEIVLSREESRQVLECMVRYHQAFQGCNHPDLCDLETHLTMLSPQAIGSVESEAEIVASVLHGWDAFPRLVPKEVVNATFAVHRHPQLFAARMRSFGTTLVHSDLWFSNIGVSGSGLVVLDWSLAAEAPGTLDFALYLLGNAGAIQASREEIIEDYCSVAGTPPDSEALEYAFASALIEYGWLLAISSLHGWITEDDLAWWVAKARGVYLRLDLL